MVLNYVVPMKANWWLVGSSLFIYGPAVASYMVEDYPRTAYYTTVATVSVVYHATKHPVIFWIDFATANSMVITVIPVIFSRWYMVPSWAVVVAYASFVFYYGHAKRDLIWHPDPRIATSFHVSLHWLGSFAHMIAILITSSSLALEHSSTPKCRLAVDDVQ